MRLVLKYEWYEEEKIVIDKLHAPAIAAAEAEELTSCTSTCSYTCA